MKPLFRANRWSLNIDLFGISLKFEISEYLNIREIISQR